MKQNGRPFATQFNFISFIANPDLLPSLYLNLAFTFPKAKITSKTKNSLLAPSTLYHALIPLYLFYSFGNKYWKITRLNWILVLKAVKSMTNATDHCLMTTQNIDMTHYITQNDNTPWPRLKKYTQKCGGISSNEFHKKWIIGIWQNDKIKILVAVLELPAKQHFRFGQYCPILR